MNVGSWRLLRQGIGQKPLGKHWEKRWGRGVVESNFIINCNFFVFLVVVEVAYKLYFLNECGYLETVQTGNWAEAIG